MVRETKVSIDIELNENVLNCENVWICGLNIDWKVEKWLNWKCEKLWLNCGYMWYNTLLTSRASRI